MKLHVTLLSAAIASVIVASPVWADGSETRNTETRNTETRGTETPVTTSARPTEGTEGSRPDSRPPEQKARETEKDKDDARTLPQTKPATGGSGYVQADKTVHYPGDKFSLKAVVPKNLTDVWAGKAVVKIVITMPGDLGAVVVDVPTPASDQATQGDKPRQLTELPADVMATLPAGDYQMAMIVTKLGGDPLKLNDWYGGFKAMLGVKRVKIAATTTPDAEDPNKTGEVTGDTDSDGYPDSDSNMPPPPPPTVGTTTRPATDAGKTAFDTNCASCHGTPNKIMAAADPAKTRAAIDSNKGGMGSLKALTSQQLNEIAAYVKGSTTASGGTMTTQGIRG